MPENYDERLTELYAGRFKNIRLFVPDAYDLVLSKLTRNIIRIILTALLLLGLCKISLPPKFKGCIVPTSGAD